MKIVVLGYIVRAPLGGLAWHHFQYFLGLNALGHDVLFVEDSDDFPGCYNPSTYTTTTDPTYGIEFIENLFRRYDVQQHWSYNDVHAKRWYGQQEAVVKQFCSHADIVLNLSAVNPLREWWHKVPVRVYVDTDPGFTQIRHLQEHDSMVQALEHTHHFTFGENFGKAGCTIPDDGLKWRPTRQPIYLPAWKVQVAPNYSRWTTVMQWDSYKVREYNGEAYGMKSTSFKEFMNLPLLVPTETLELAIGGANSPLDEMNTNGWKTISSLIPTHTPSSYQQYIAESKGEWTIAKSGYVMSRSGWFSERSACYLATGKPVITQDTGFTDFISGNEGLLAFSSAEEAAEQLRHVSADYKHHCLQARSIVEAEFESGTVLEKLLMSLT
jgi:hypothetical protein